MFLNLDVITLAIRCKLHLASIGCTSPQNQKKIARCFFKASKKQIRIKWQRYIMSTF